MEERISERSRCRRTRESRQCLPSRELSGNGLGGISCRLIHLTGLLDKLDSNEHTHGCTDNGLGNTFDFAQIWGTRRRRIAKRGIKYSNDASYVGESVHVLLRPVHSTQPNLHTFETTLGIVDQINQSYPIAVTTATGNKRYNG